MDRNMYGIVVVVICAVLLVWFLSNRNTGSGNIADDAARDLKKMGQEVKEDVRDMTR